MAILEHFYPGDSVVAGFLVVAVAVATVSAVALLVSYGFKSRAAMRHSVLFCALICILATPALAAALSASGLTSFGWPLYSTENAATLAVSTGPSLADGLSNGPAVPPIPPTLPAGTATLPPDNGPGAKGESGSIMTAPAEVPAQATALPQNRRRQLANCALLVWIVVAIALLLGFARSCVRIMRLRSALRPVLDERLPEMLDEIKRLLGVAISPSIGISDSVRTPVVAGWIRPVIVLPATAVAQIARDQLRDVLVHEAAHVIRRDQLVLPLQVLAQALFWPIPLIRLLNRQLDCAREEVCDNFVLATRDAVRYGETLLWLAELAHGSKPLVSTTGILHWHGKLESRIASLISKRRDTAKTTGRFTAIVTLTLFALASGLVCGTRIVAQQNQAPDQKEHDQKKPASRPSEAVPRGERPAPAVESRFFIRRLSGAQEEPVFFDVETERYFTLPPDLVPKENGGKTIEQWVLTDALKAWARSQRIDFAVQTDGRTHVAVIGFDVRTGGAFPQGAGNLGPEVILKAIEPPILDAAKWNFTKNLADVIPFVTREGDIGTFSVGVNPFLWPGSVEFRCELARGPEVAQLAGQPVVPVSEPAILGSIGGVLIADVTDQKLRLRLADAPHEILVGGGQVIVRGPSGIEIRATRLGTANLEVDGTTDRVTLGREPRGLRAVLRRVGQRVQIEKDARVAETGRLSLRLPRLKLSDEESLSWKPAPAQPSDVVEKQTRSEVRRKNREAGARFLAKMAEQGYGLRPGQSVRHIAIPFPSARAEYWGAAHPTQYYPMGPLPGGPEAATYRWDGKELREWFVTGGSFHVTGLLDALQGIKSQDLSGPPDLLATPLPGDWVVRPGTSDAQLVQELETILRGEFKLPIHLEFRDAKRDAYVARGRFHFTPLPRQLGAGQAGAADKNHVSVQIFGKRLYPGPPYAGGGYGDFNEFLKWAGRWIDAPIVNEVAEPPQRLTWRLHGHGGHSSFVPSTKNEDHDPALVLANIERQTGLHFAKESRPVKTLFVERKE
jgi:beta-lactamase regulating signal transducer with metallopeptidase domain